jgi:hypothetical protein
MFWLYKINSDSCNNNSSIWLISKSDALKYTICMFILIQVYLKIKFWVLILIKKKKNSNAQYTSYCWIKVLQISVNNI